MGAARRAEEVGLRVAARVDARFSRSARTRVRRLDRASSRCATRIARARGARGLRRLPARDRRLLRRRRGRPARPQRARQGLGGPRGRAAGARARHFCIDAGGDVLVRGGPWRVGVRHPRRGASVAALSPTDAAVAMSAPTSATTTCSTRSAPAGAGSAVGDGARPGRSAVADAYADRGVRDGERGPAWTAKLRGSTRDDARGPRRAGALPGLARPRRPLDAGRRRSDRRAADSAALAMWVAASARACSATSCSPTPTSRAAGRRRGADVATAAGEQPAAALRARRAGWALGDPEVGCGFPRCSWARRGAAPLRGGPARGGPRAGLWAAALWTLSPFALFYGTEGAPTRRCVLLARSPPRRGRGARGCSTHCRVRRDLHALHGGVRVAAQAAWFARGREDLAAAVWPPRRRGRLPALDAAAGRAERDSSSAAIGALYPLTLPLFSEGLAASSAAILRPGA